MAKTVAQRNRAVRQEQFRELLSNKGLVQKVLEDADKISELASIEVDLDDKESQLEFALAKDRVAMLKVGIDTRLRLINKFCPDLKQQEIVGEAGEKIIASVPVTFAAPEDDEKD